MTRDHSYEEVMAERSEIMRSSVGIDYSQYINGVLAFDYERLLSETGYDVDAAQAIQHQTGVGNTPLLELHNVTALVRSVARPTLWSSPLAAERT